MSADVHVRLGDPDRDGAACAAVYAPWITESFISFEHEPPTAQEMARRMRAAHVWFVAERDGAVVGYSYASPHRERAAYRFAADTAVYLAADHHGSGVGRALYDRLIPAMRDLGFWILCGGVAQPNPASDALHRATGFREVGVYERIGWKAGAWRDVRWWQLHLRPGDPAPPDAGGR
jgi:phosphinothricin acetyltransferase